MFLLSRNLHFRQGCDSAVKEIMSFGNKRMVVVITGAAGELGRKFAERFAKALSPDSLLILSSRSRAQLEPLKVRSFYYIK